VERVANCYLNVLIGVPAVYWAIHMPLGDRPFIIGGVVFCLVAVGAAIRLSPRLYTGYHRLWPLSFNGGERKAFQIAPMAAPIAWGSLLIIPVLASVFAENPGNPSSLGALIVAISAIMAIISYVTTFTFGLAVYRFMVVRRLISFWMAVVSGLVTGPVSWYFFALSYVAIVGGFSPAVTVASSPLMALLGGLASICGAIVGATFWVMARPDRRPTWSDEPIRS
jgi:hypothetical protein